MPFVDVVRALYDYAPQSEEELEVREGDLLFVLDKSDDDDWWKCKKKAASDDDEEPEGLVPNNYVEEVQPISHAKALYDYAQQTDEELSFKEDTRLDVYDETDPDWTLVGHNGKYGFAPAIYIERVDAATAAAAAAPAASAPPPARVLAPAPPSIHARPPPADDEPLPGEADYVPPASPQSAAGNPAAALAGIIAQRTGGATASPSTDRGLASPAKPQRPEYTPEQSDEEAAPSLPRRPPSQAMSPTSPAPLQTQYASRLSPEPAGVLASPPYNRAAPAPYDDDYADEVTSTRGFHLYNVHEMVSHMGKNKKMPTTLGINIAKGIIMISPEKSRDGPSKEWTAEKLTHYSIEGKHVFVELIRPSKSIDFHAGAKDTAQEIVSALGELAGAVRQEGLREVLAASAGTGGGLKKGRMLYEFMAQGDDEVTVAQEDEVIILDDAKSEEWWMVRRLKNGKEGVVPSSYVEVTGTISQGAETITGLNAARSTVEQNRLEEERLTKQAARKDKKRESDVIPPERNSSLAGDTRRTSMRSSDKRSSKDQPKSKPNASRVRTWEDRSGTFKVEAEFIGLREGKIHLHKLNGVKIAVPVSKMAVQDLEYVERATGASLDEDKPLSDIKRRNTQRQREQNGTRSAAGASVQRKEDYDWFDFFLQCGVDPHICERYAGSFSKDNMGPEILPDVNSQLLRTLGLKEGDILRVMKFLDNKYDRHLQVASSTGGDESSNGGLFAGPGGVLKNNTRKGRPAPAVQTNDVVDESTFKDKSESAGVKTPLADAKSGSASAGQSNGFDDDAWDVKPQRTQTPASAVMPTPAPVQEPAKPLINDDIASLSISAPPLQPTPAPQPQPAMQAQQPAQAAQAAAPPVPPVANQAIFDKIASLAPAARQQQPQQTGFQQPMQTGYQQSTMPRQRPAAPPQQNGGSFSMPPPPRAASAPGFPPQQQSSFGPPPLQAQLTGYQPQNQVPQQQQFQPMQPQQTAYQPQGFNQVFPQQNSIQAMQQNYPPMQPQPTGFQPQSQFGQQYGQQYGQGQTPYQQQPVNGAQTGSPFADPPRQPYQPMPSGLSNSFTAQQTGFQPSFNMSQPTGMNGYATQPAPSLPPQQTGGVFGPSQPLSIPAAPLVPQKTGPPPPVRFGLQPGAKPLMPQPTGRANLSKASKYTTFHDYVFCATRLTFTFSSAKSIRLLSVITGDRCLYHVKQL